MQITRRHLSLAAGMAAAVALTAGALIASTAQAAPATGTPAPAFSGVTSAGEAISLADFAGRTVVMEWTNDGCPFVKKHYTAPPSNMQTLQKNAAADDVVWISVISSAEGEQGFADAARANELTASRGAAPAHVVLDAEGTVGKLYGAKTTPHMFIITPDGNLAYDGAIDSKSSARVADIDTATNYVTAALADLEAGKLVTMPVTKPYGCSVKYK